MRKVLWMTVFGVALALGTSSCTGFRNECLDGIDNDNDGRVDDDDPGCSNTGGSGLSDEQRRKLQEQACGSGSQSAGLPVNNPACLRVNVGTRESDDPACFDRVDNDEDTFIDLHDLGCESEFDDDETNPACSDGEDNDEDGLIDFQADPGCLNDSNATSESNEPPCMDRIDNDGDGLIDFPWDLGCETIWDPLELGNECSDGIDNDKDGFCDAAGSTCSDGTPGDEDCASFASKREAAYQCNDKIDNDLDGYIDHAGLRDENDDLLTAADFGCDSRFDNDESDNPQCSDNIDNDEDGLIDVAGLDFNRDGVIDIPLDPGCLSPLDDSEDALACADGLDNDGDTKIDYPEDPDCDSVLDDNEATPECMNAIDDDFDSLIDFPFDPGCLTLRDDSEVTARCSDGQDNDGDGNTDFPADMQCTSFDDESEMDFFDTTPECNDYIDNDGDGYIDTTHPDDPSYNLGDPACDAGAQLEALDPVCSDRVDNDGDGFADYDGIDLNDDDKFDLPGEYEPDPGCFHPLHFTESFVPECADNTDNDGDGQQDWDGLDINGDGFFDKDAGDLPPDDACDGEDDPGATAGRPGRPYRDNDESRPSQCDDNIDNDGDGLMDFEPEFFTNGSPNPNYLDRDPQCPNIFHNNEAEAPQL